MFFNTLAVIGLALSSQETVNETPNTRYAAESSHTANPDVTHDSGETPKTAYSFDYGIDYEFSPTFGGLVVGYADLIGFALGLLIGVALLARRLETGTWPVPRYVRSLVIPVVLVAAGFGVTFSEGLPVLESLLGLAGPSWGRGIALAATIAYDAVLIGTDLVLPKSRPPANA